MSPIPPLEVEEGDADREEEGEGKAGEKEMGGATNPEMAHSLKGAWIGGSQREEGMRCTTSPL
jgi:hypothetical protein